MTTEKCKSGQEETDLRTLCCHTDPGTAGSLQPLYDPALSSQQRTASQSPLLPAGVPRHWIAVQPIKAAQSPQKDGT